MKLDSHVSSESDEGTGDDEDEEESDNESVEGTFTVNEEPTLSNPGLENGNEHKAAENDKTPNGESTEKEEDQCKKKKKKKRRPLGINLTNCKYESVRRAARLCGLREVGEDEEWTVFWTDCSVSLERVMEMKRFQKINHFPGMSEICRKDLLARNMNRLLKLFPKEYNIFPRTWCLPADYGDLQAYCRTKKNKTYICKPDSGCQGKGIFLSKNMKDIKHGEHMICQQYVSKPFLISGYKFDLRIYVLVTSCEPLRIFIYKEGLARFATMTYTEPSHSNLVNHSPSFTTDSRLDREVKDALLSDTLNLINLRACDKRKVIEEDKRRVKERLLQRNLPKENRREQLETTQAAWLEQAEKYEDSHLGGYQRIYPQNKGDKYEKFFKHSGSLFQETAASRAREECARQQLEELRLKQEQKDMPSGKKKKETLQGESAGEKPVKYKVTRRPSTRAVSSGCRTAERKGQEVKMDSMKPVDIDEREELERLQGLQQREKLIRALGIVDQVYRLFSTMEPKTPDLQPQDYSLLHAQTKNQTQFNQGILMYQDTEGNMCFLPASCLGGTVIDNQSSATSNHIHSGYPTRFSSFLATGTPPPTHYASRRYAHQKPLPWNGVQTLRTMATVTEPNSFIKPLKSGGQIRLTSAKAKIEQKTLPSKKPTHFNGIFTGSVNNLPPHVKGCSAPSTGCTLPAVGGTSSADQQLAITSTSAPIAQRPDQSRRYPMGTFNLNINWRWT
ncbi:tubulin polyglutamylase TTLL13 isoform X3 [Hyperolius riggenbachi]|uniref:tubulin polyglutamylase TTLL13 isoform X3 n=1 Tax=Hyperolius riggenbachi TaxID=752182 RepID=UPI0035A29116